MNDDFFKIYDGGTDVTTLLKKLSGANIFFGHQSVGYNIVEGIEQWSDETGVMPNLVNLKEFKDLLLPAFVHFNIGQNQDPISKIDDFEGVLDQVPVNSNAIAFFKFCYVDIVDTTDVDPLFNYYKEKMIELRERHPDINIVLVTAPYTGIQKGPRALVKRMLFMPLAGELENIKRNEFNERLLEELGHDFPVFDLAKVESTLPDGTLNIYKYKGDTYPSLAYEYTDDLGHLNSNGSKLVAYNLVAFLAIEIDR